MYKYYMTIDNEPYNALFIDHFEAAAFLKENDDAGSIVILHKYIEVSIEDILNDQEFEWSYQIEIIAKSLFPSAYKGHKVDYLEHLLKELGIIP